MCSLFFSDRWRYAHYKQEQYVHSFFLIAGSMFIINEQCVHSFFLIAGGMFIINEQCVHSFFLIAGGMFIINKNNVFTLFFWSQEAGLTLEGEEVALWLLTSLCTSAKREVEVALLILTVLTIKHRYIFTTKFPFFKPPL